MFNFNFCYSQKDTIYITDNSIEDIIKASAIDSMVHDQKNRILYLYGDAHVFYEKIAINASFIQVDFSKNEVYASYTLDKDSNRVGVPVFTDGVEDVVASKIKYNFNTKKGFIQETKIKQDENFLYMEVAKIHANEDIHFKKGRFTSCNLEEPHYHFQLSKAILIPEKRIVSGPMNLWVMGIPTPLGLPFIFIPQKKLKNKNMDLFFHNIVCNHHMEWGYKI